MTPYYQSIENECQKLTQRFRDGCCYVVRNGVVSQVPLKLAAKVLVEKTHTLASEAEIQAFLDSQRLNRPAISSLDQAREAFAKFIKDGPRA